MRIYIALLLLALYFGCTPVIAQHTFDVKYPIYSSTSASYGGLLRITPTKILANGNNNSSKPVLITFDNDGMITQQLTLGFHIGSSPFYWYNSDSNTIAMLITDSYNLYFMHVDTNLNVKSEITLDSTITGMPPEYNYIYEIRFLKLKDSTIIVSADFSIGRVTPTSKKKHTAFRLSRNGKFLGRHIFDSKSISENPLFQTPRGEIVWNYSYYDSLKQYHSGLKTSDTTFIFNLGTVLPDAPPFIPDSYDRKSLIPTTDGGFALLNLQGEWPLITTTHLLKFDSMYRKQWETTLPGIDARALHLIESKSGGFYIITQTITDTTLKYEFPAACFLDIAFSRVDASGRHIFTAYYGSGTCTQEPVSVFPDDDGGIIISGIYNTSRGSNCEFTCNQRDSVWVFKIDTLGQSARKITGIAESSGGRLSMRLYPNPSSGELTVDLGQESFYHSMEIIDINGSIVKRFPILDIGKSQIVVDILELPSGTYFCRLRAKTSSITRPFVIQR